MAVVADTGEQYWLSDAQRRAAGRGDARGRAAADPRRRGHGQDDDALRARRLAGRARASPAERILLLTFTRRAAREMLQRARGAGAPAAVARVLGGTFHSVAHRLVRAARGGARAAGRLRRARRGRRRRPARPVREEHGHAESRTRFPRKGTLLDIYSRTVNAQQPLLERRRRSTSRGATEHARGARGAVPRLHGAQARARRARPRRPAAVLARAGRATR